MAKSAHRAGTVVAGALALALAACASPAPPELPGPWAAPAAISPVDPTAAYAQARLADMTLREKVASLLMIHVPGTDAAPIRAVLDATGVAGVIYMGNNVPASVAELAEVSTALSRDPDLPVLIAIDQEGGIVRRLPGDTAASAVQLRGQAAEAARVAFAARSALVASAGVTINFGIVADVTADPGSFIYSRVLGTDAGSAADRVAAAVAGEQGTVLSTLKHFPGHGEVSGDSHVSVPTTALDYATWRARVAPPFEAGIAAGAELVMLGHLRYTAIDSAPASLSAEWNRILREDLGFDGIIVTDDMTMLENSGEPAYADPFANAVAAVAAGDTLLLYVGRVDIAGVVAAIVAAVEDGRIDEAMIDDAALRLLEARRAESGREGPYITCGDICRDLVA
jgi:beta-N-acetylhexosaminidase